MDPAADNDAVKDRARPAMSLTPDAVAGALALYTTGAAAVVVGTGV